MYFCGSIVKSSRRSNVFHYYPLAFVLAAQVHRRNVALPRLLAPCLLNPSKRHKIKCEYRPANFPRELDIDPALHSRLKSSTPLLQCVVSSVTTYDSLFAVVFALRAGLAHDQPPPLLHTSSERLLLMYNPGVGRVNHPRLSLRRTSIRATDNSTRNSCRFCRHICHIAAKCSAHVRKQRRNLCLLCSRPCLT